MQAPSAGNQQPWEFIVVEKKSILTALADMSPYSRPVAGAPAAIVFLANRNRFRYPDYWQQDMSAAAENFLLEAVHLELGAVWLSVSPVKERESFIIDLFELSDNLIPFCVIPVGYPADGHESRLVDRFEKDRIHLNKY